MDCLLSDRKEIEPRSKKVKVKKRNGREERREEMREKRSQEPDAKAGNGANSHEVSLVTTEDVRAQVSYDFQQRPKGSRLVIPYSKSDTMP